MISILAIHIDIKAGVWKRLGEGLLGMKGAQKGKEGDGPSKNEDDVKGPPEDPDLPRSSSVFPLLQPTTASSQRHPPMPTSGPWTSPPWATHSSIPARRASPSRVAPSTAPAKLMAAGRANRPSAWVSVPLGDLSGVGGQRGQLSSSERR